MLLFALGDHRYTVNGKHDIVVAGNVAPHACRAACVLIVIRSMPSSSVIQYFAATASERISVGIRTHRSTCTPRLRGATAPTSTTG